MTRIRTHRRARGKPGRLVRALRIGLVVLLLPLLVVLSLPFVILLGPFIAWDRFRTYACLRKFRRTHAGRIFLVWLSRRGWNEVVCNNNLPALPVGVTGVRQQRGRPDNDAVSEFLTAAQIKGVQRPFLLIVEEQRCRVVSLHAALRPFKARAMRDQSVQDELRQVLRDAR